VTRKATTEDFLKSPQAIIHWQGQDASLREIIKFLQEQGLGSSPSKGRTRGVRQVPGDSDDSEPEGYQPSSRRETEWDRVSEEEDEDDVIQEEESRGIQYLPDQQMRDQRSESKGEEREEIEQENSSPIR